MKARPLPPCPNCKLSTGAYEPVIRQNGGEDRTFWRITCSSCEASAGVSSSKASVLKWWSNGEVLTPLASARVRKELEKPHIFRTSFPGLGQPASRYRLISGLTAKSRIRFCPGKHGRVDKFYLDEGGKHPDHPHPYICHVDLTTQPGEETLAILRELDRLVSVDPELVASPIYEGGRLWFLFPRKDSSRITDNDSADLYERRRMEQERLLRGDITRGHKAFGFMPLEGYQ